MTSKVQAIWPIISVRTRMNNYLSVHKNTRMCCDGDVKEKKEEKDEMKISFDLNVILKLATSSVLDQYR